MLLGRFELFLARRLFILVILNLRADDKDLTPLPHQLADEAVETRAVALVHGKGVHLLPSGRQLVDDRDVQIAVDHQRERARDRCGGHDEHMGLFPFADQRRALPDTEAVLLVRDDEAEARIDDILGKKGVRADDKVVFPGRNRGLRLALFFGAHGPGQSADAHSKRSEQAGKRGKMLLGEDLRRRHEGADKAVFPAKPAQRRSDKRLAAADVALDKPVHHKAARHIPRRILDRALLRTGRRKGKRGVKGGEIPREHGDAALARALGAHRTERAGQHEQLLEHETPPRNRERVKVRRIVDVFIGVARLGKTVARADLCGQQIGQLASALVKPLAHRVADRALVQRGVHPVDRQDAARHAARLVLLFIGGVDHAEMAAVPLDLAIEADAVAARELILDIVLVEICYVNRSALVHRTELDKLHPPSDADKARHIRHKRADTHALPLRRGGDRAESGPILVARGEIGHKIIERKDAELSERLRLFLPYSLDIPYGCG